MGTEDDPNPAVWGALTPLVAPTLAGRRDDVGGYVITDPLPVVLREISPDWLRAGGERVRGVLARHGLLPDDLAVGWMHAGETALPGDRHSPAAGFGWTSRALYPASDAQEAVYKGLEAELSLGDGPRLGWAATWRSLRFRVAPDDGERALALLTHLIVDDTFWRAELGSCDEPLRGLALARASGDAARMERAFAAVEASFGARGASIVRAAIARAGPVDSR